MRSPPGASARADGPAGWKDQEEAWERLYRRRGRPWGGAVELPVLGPGERALEVGCGGGRLLLPLLRLKGCDVVGLDLSRSSLRALARSSGGRLVQADAARLPFRDGAFDAVLCRHVLGHLAGGERRAASAEAFRVLRDEGKLLFEAFSTADARHGRGLVVEEGTFLRGEGIACHYFTEAEVRSLLGQARSLSLRKRRWSERASSGVLRREVLEALAVK